MRDFYVAILVPYVPEIFPSWKANKKSFGIQIG